MSYITFKRESNDFNDILNDSVLKNCFKFKIQFLGGLIMMKPSKEELLSYIELKYGESIINEVVPDRSPIPNKDYIPKKN